MKVLVNCLLVAGIAPYLMCDPKIINRLLERLVLNKQERPHCVRSRPVHCVVPNNTH